MLRKRLNDKGKNWRHVYKSLKVLSYCLRFGSQGVVDWAKKNRVLIHTLDRFEHVDQSTGVDYGVNGGFCRWLLFIHSVIHPFLLFSSFPFLPFPHLSFPLVSFLRPRLTQIPSSMLSPQRCKRNHGPHLG